MEEPQRTGRQPGPEDSRPEVPVIRSIKCGWCGRYIIGWSSCRENPPILANLDSLYLMMKEHKHKLGIVTVAPRYTVHEESTGDV